jgi:O-antigen ligase
VTHTVRQFFGRHDLLGWLIMAVLGVSVLLGGASRVHAGPLAIVELTAIPLLCVAMFRLYATRAWRAHRVALGLAAAVVALPLIQLVPLPPQIWTNLPGRADMVLALELVGLQPGWTTLSLTPDTTWASVLALIPPIAMFLAVVLTPLEQRRDIAAIYVLATAFNIVLGAAQLASGGERLFPYETTDAGNMVGMFANRNHLATMTLMALPLAAGAFLASRSRDPRGFERGLWKVGAYAVLAIVAIGAIRSRAGLILVGPALIATLAMIWFGARGGQARWQVVGIAAGAAAGIAAVAAFALGPILARFDPEYLAQQGRLENWPVVIDVAGRHQPFGTGFGSFDPVYRSAEPLETLDWTFFNHAHNEYLEVWLEAGWPGLILLGAVLVWAARRWFPQWSADRIRRSEGRMALAGGIGLAVVVLHSALDYPIRTETIAVMTAFCLGLLCEAPTRGQRRS